MQAHLGFPAGIVALKTSEWPLRTRWYMWLLPQAPLPQQTAVHMAMREVLLANLLAGVCPAVIGTPAFDPRAPAAAAAATEPGAQITAKSADGPPLKAART